MNKKDIVEKVALKEGMTKEKVESVLDTLVELIKKSVKIGHDVKLKDFGTFTKSKRRARNYRNPRNGKPIKFPAVWTPKFRAGDEFRQLVK